MGGAEDNKAEEVRKYLEAHPGVGPKEVVTALATKGIEITAGYVSTIKQRLRANGGTKKKPSKTRAAKGRAATKSGTATGSASPGGRKKVARPYPRASLEEALKIPYVIKDKNGGNPWPPDDVAKAVDMSKMTNSFFYAAAAARAFGLTEGSRDTETISLTAEGKALVFAPDGETEERLKREAFLRIELFRRVLEHYKGSNLPEMKYLGNTLQREFGLDPETHEEFSALFRQNCEYLKIGSGFTTAATSKTPTDEATPRRPTTVTLAEPKSGSSLVAFVIMPFVERQKEQHSTGFFAEVLRTLVTPAAREAGFNVRTANRQGSDVIQSTIINDLLSADLVIADLTEHNPNVLFELGVRMAHEKPVALIKASGTGRIFDVDNMLRVEEYNSNLWPTTVEKDLPVLTEHIRAAWDNRESKQTYMGILKSQATATQK